ncbi:MAG: hypothetical protein VYE22_23410 [Myxococcota bacterium]|nr:hypothetical protein [Myxococcota bacterium]
MDLLARIGIGAGAFLLLVLYFGWRWHRAGKWVEAQNAAKEKTKRDVAAALADPRFQPALAHIRANYPFSEDGSDPTAWRVWHASLVDDQGRTYQLTTPGSTRAVILLMRRQPHEQRYVSMSLADGVIREDPAPHGWTYVGPAR